MEQSPQKNTDRRYYHRTDIGSPVAYKPYNDESYRDGILVNISETGALIGVNEKLELDTHLYLKMESGEENEPPIQMLAETIRVAEKLEGYEYCYGCMILDVFY